MNPALLMGLWNQCHRELGNYCTETMETIPSENVVISNSINPRSHLIYSSGAYCYIECSLVTEAGKDLAHVYFPFSHSSQESHLLLFQLRADLKFFSHWDLRSIKTLMFTVQLSYAKGSVACMRESLSKIRHGSSYVTESANDPSQREPISSKSLMSHS